MLQTIKLEYVLRIIVGIIVFNKKKLLFLQQSFFYS